MRSTSLILSLFLLNSLLVMGQIGNNPCLSGSSFHIVVLGSSTAAGSGPSSSDSAWVNRYRKALQSINPANQVTNLAIGGTTTYHIMPDWYVAPTGRPNTNSNNNVSRAITLNADAIIVNMPSNDASNGFGTLEQMHNFITIAQVADSAGIPTWVCSTQPRNGFNAAKRQIQVEVRDSILSYFGPYAIDFWNPFADSLNGLKAEFNSGDGVHMNDTAHGILEAKVLAEGILDSIFFPLNYVDHQIKDVFWQNTSICGDSNSLLNIVIANVGIAAIDTIEVLASFSNTVNSSSFTLTQAMSGLFSSCSLDTISFSVNTYQKSKLEHQAILNTTDSITSNDSSAIQFYNSIGHPEILPLNDTFCLGDTLQFEVSSNSGKDHILWFTSALEDSIVFIGNPLNEGPHINNTSYFAQSVRGNLTNQESLKASTTSTTNWNGYMFNITAYDSIILDSISLKINSTGNQAIIAYYKTGSYVGHENSASSWTSWSTVNVNVAAAGDFVSLDLPDLSLNSGDTIGVYLHMSNSSSTLSYRSGTATDYSNSKMGILRGSGIAYTFGQIYSPRMFCGEVHYHYGFNANGYCSTEKIKVEPFVSDPTFSLGNDTVISKSSSLTLSSNRVYKSYLWSTGSIDSIITIDTSNFTADSNLIWLEVKDAFGCVFTDSIEVSFDKYSGKLKSSINEFEFFPNPVSDKLTIRLKYKPQQLVLQVFSVEGKLILKEQYFNEQSISLDIELEKGVYVAVLTEGSNQHHFKFIKK